MGSGFAVLADLGATERQRRRSGRDHRHLGWPWHRGRTDHVIARRVPLDVQSRPVLLAVCSSQRAFLNAVFSGMPPRIPHPRLVSPNPASHVHTSAGWVVENPRPERGHLNPRPPVPLSESPCGSGLTGKGPEVRDIRRLIGILNRRPGPENGSRVRGEQRVGENSVCVTSVHGRAGRSPGTSAGTSTSTHSK